MTNNGAEPCRLRVVRKCPDIDWERVWKNLHSRVLSASLTSTWYVVIHEIVPTNDRLEAIHLSPTSARSNCGQEDSIPHRIRLWRRPDHMELGTDEMGIILRMDPKYTFKEWTLRPFFIFWPRQRQAAILWIQAHLVHYRLQTHWRLSIYEFMDFLRRSRW